MKFIIIGSGDVGTSLSMKLAAQDHDVVLVEHDEEQIDPALAGLDLQLVIGHGLSPQVLEKAGIHSADYVIAVTNSDEVNISSCFISRLLNPAPKRICRLRDVNLLGSSIQPELLNEYFDLIINPEQAGADYLLQLFKLPGAREFIELAFGKVRVIGLGITPQSPILGRKFDTLHEETSDDGLLIVAIMRGNKLVIPRGDDKIRNGDVIYAVTTPESTDRLFTLAGRELVEGRTAMIWGGSALARNVALRLDGMTTSLKLILSEEDEQLHMADQLKRTLILNGEGTDQNLLIEENIAETDAFIAASEDEENNVLAALVAKKLGARTVMALVNNSTYLPLVSAVGVDVVLSSRLAAASSIFRHIHAGSMISEISLQSESASFVELDISASMPIAGRKLADAKLPYGITVCVVLREGQALIPGPQEVLTEGDRVIIFVLKSAVNKLEKLLQLKLV